MKNIEPEVFCKECNWKGTWDEAIAHIKGRHGSPACPECGGVEIEDIPEEEENEPSN